MTLFFSSDGEERVNACLIDVVIPINKFVALNTEK